MIKPPNFDMWNPAMRGAYTKGYRAAQDGIGVDSCPYEDKRKWCGRLTWSRAFIAAWRDGWIDYHKQHCPITQYYSDRAESGLAALAK